MGNPYASKNHVPRERVAPVAPEDLVPAGTVGETLDWVGSDPDRAQKALDAEKSGHKRKTLITKLEEIIAE